MTSDLRVVDVDKLSFFELRAQLKACIVRKKQFHNDVLVQTKCIDRLKRKIGDLVKGELTLKNQRMTEKIVRLQNVIRLKGEIIKRYSSKYGAPPPKYEVPEEFVCSADELEAIEQEATASEVNGENVRRLSMETIKEKQRKMVDEFETLTTLRKVRNDQLIVYSKSNGMDRDRLDRNIAATEMEIISVMETLSKLSQFEVKNMLESDSELGDLLKARNFKAPWMEFN